MQILDRSVRAVGSGLGIALAALLMAPLQRSALADTLVVVNKADNNVSLLDTESGRLRAKVPTGYRPHEVAISPNGRWALVTNFGTDREPGRTLTLIDVEEARAIDDIDLAPHMHPHGVAWHPDGERALVTTEGSDSMLVVEVASRRILMEMATQGEGSHMVSIAPDGERAYVTNVESGSVTGFDLKRHRRLGVAITGVGAEGLAIRPDGKQIWVANRGAGTVSVLSSDDMSVVTTLRAERAPIRVAFTPDGATALVTNAVSGSVSVFDAQRLVELHDFSTRAGFTLRDGRFLGGLFGLIPLPVGMLVSPDGESVYVSNAWSGRVGRFRISDGERLEALALGDEPDGLAYSPREVLGDVAER